MDSLTHIALGACIGEAFLGKKIGKRAMFLGAVAQSIPDIDFLAAFWLDTTDNLLAHRGFTHSILFAILITFFMSVVSERWHRPHNISLRKWMYFFGAETFIHILLDSLNNYGVGWFEPFSHLRISFNTIYVADPFFSIWIGIAFLALLILKRNHPKRRFWYRFGIAMSFLYLLYCGINKLIIFKRTNEIVKRQQLPHDRYFTTPSPLNNWLWFVVTGNDSGYYAGYRSVFDRSPTMDFTYFPRNENLLGTMKDSSDIQQLIRFSQQFYTVEKWNDTLVFNDLRFGQVIGWQDPKEDFAFHYFINLPSENKLVVQRGRFAKWNKQSFNALLRRIKGN